VYHRVIDAYLLVDREAETSIKYFTLQLFTVPSVALHIVRNHNLISRLLTIITSFFTNQIQDKRIVLQSKSPAEVDVDSYPFKSKRFMPVFSDLRYICHNEPVQQLIAHNHDFLVQFASACQLFMCVNPNKRVVNHHVEYETDAWISVFNVTLSLSRVIKVYGEAFSRSTAAELVAAISKVVHKILMVCTLSDDRLDKTKFSPISFHDVVFGDTPYHIIEFDVMEGWVSFHHSLHWLLAELFKHVNILSEDSLKEVGLSSVRDVVLRNASERAMLTVIDFPLRGEMANCRPFAFIHKIPGHSPRDDRPNTDRAVGPQWLRYPRTAFALSRFHASRALL
jgi:E3 ubiquitin-protein ligase UBR1